MGDPGEDQLLSGVSHVRNAGRFPHARCGGHSRVEATAAEPITPSGSDALTTGQRNASA